MPPPHTPWTFRLVPLALCLVVALLVVAMPVRVWIDHLFVGDAAAYPIIAHGLATGAGPTYDGLTDTNGFHPLWAIAQLPLMLGADAPLDRLGHVKLLVVAIVLGAAFAWRHVVAMYTDSKLAGWLMLALVGASGWSVYVLYSGLETPLALLLIALVYLVAHPITTGAPVTFPRGGLVGLAMGLCFLSRLDTVFLLVPLAIVLLPPLVRSGPGPTLAAAGAGLSTAAPYIVFNVINFGHPTPVSGIVKLHDHPGFRSGAETMRDAVSRLGQLVPESLAPAVPVVAVFAGVAMAVAAIGILRRLPDRTPFNLLALLPVGAALHGTYYALFIRELFVPWHLYLHALTLFVLVAFVPALVPRRRFGVVTRHTLASTVLVGLLVTGAGYAAAKQQRRSDRACSYTAVSWIEERLPGGTRLAMYDGWYVQLLAGPSYHVLDLSGLVTDLETARRLKAGRYAEALRALEIDYILGFEPFVTRIEPVEIVERGTFPFGHRSRPFVLARRR